MPIELNNKATLLKKSLLIFYKDKENLEKFVNVIEKNTEYSLRIIEWFCSNYSKKYNIIYKLDKNTEFNVYLSYKSQLDSYQKKQFDPFKRNHKGFDKFEICNGIYTTVGQLNFFRWCINNKIFDYIQKNIKSIKDDMNKSINYIKKKGDNKTRKKRQPLSLSATRVCIKRYTRAVIEFN